MDAMRRFRRTVLFAAMAALVSVAVWRMAWQTPGPIENTNAGVVAEIL